MFFSVSNQPRRDFPFHHGMGSLVLSVDSGWSTIVHDRYHIVYKGYVDRGSVEQILPHIIETPSVDVTGNFCAFIQDTQSGSVYVRSDKFRSFPIYRHANQITNLEPSADVIWTDSTITIKSDLGIEEMKQEVIGSIDTSPLDFDRVVEKVDDILHRKTEDFLASNNLPIRVFLSGGVDSLLVYAYLKHHTSDYELVPCSHIDYDRFWLMNSGTIRQNWGYTQIHHWKTPCVLTSGAPGDEFMLRSPYTVNWYLRYHGISIDSLLNDTKWRSCLHREYYLKKTNAEIFRNRPEVSVDNLYDLYWHMCNININDWQHWHLGNTLTWTPLRDLEIFKLILRLPTDNAISQIMDSQLSRHLIERLSPGLTKLISDQKNTGNIMRNLADFYYPAN